MLVVDYIFKVIDLARINEKLIKRLSKPFFTLMVMVCLLKKNFLTIASPSPRGIKNSVFCYPVSVARGKKYETMAWCVCLWETREIRFSLLLPTLLCPVELIN